MSTVLVYGAGGIGLYFAARIHATGTPVVLKARPEAVRASQADPIRVRRGEDTTEVGGVEVVDSIEGREFDAAVIATKAWQVRDAAREIAPTLVGGAPVLTTQNGVDAPAHASHHIPSAQVLAGAVVVIAKRIDTLSVEVVGPEASVTIGSLHDPTPTSVAASLLEVLRAAGVDANWADDVRTALWKKLALIASYGGVGALADATVGQTRSIPQARDLVEKAAREVLAVGNGAGARLTEDDLSDVLDIYERHFSPETTASLQRDIREGRPSELHDQSGAVVVHAAKLGIAAPVHETIFAALLPRETAARATIE